MHGPEYAWSFEGIGQLTPHEVVWDLQELMVVKPVETTLQSAEGSATSLIRTPFLLHLDTDSSRRSSEGVLLRFRFKRRSL